MDTYMDINMIIVHRLRSTSLLVQLAKLCDGKPPGACGGM